MNAGLSNLATLKAWLLNPSLRGSTDFDSQILAIGTGVLGRFEQRCNRKFARVADFVEIFPADRTKHVVQRFPIEVVTRLEVQQVLQDGWAELTDLVINQQLDAGLLYFYGQQGWQRGLVRLTYTGGYWYNQSETDTPDTQPAGSAAVPADLLLALQLQVEATWTLRDKLGLSLGESQESRRTLTLANLQLVPEVDQILQGYIRYQMS